MVLSPANKCVDEQMGGQDGQTDDYADRHIATLASMSTAEDKPSGSSGIAMSFRVVSGLTRQVSRWKVCRAINIARLSSFPFRGLSNVASFPQSGVLNAS